MGEEVIDLNPLRGFRDIIGEEAEALLRFAQTFRELAEAHGYEPVIPPTLERFKLFAVKSGEEIKRSMYVFRDKAGREVALRPEATASIARVYLRLLRAKPKPVKVYYVVNCFRYEEPQRARYREFWQAGVEYIGGESPEAEFDTIKLLANFYKRIGLLDKITLKIGTTRLYRQLFTAYGISEEKQDHILHLMDKKMFNEALELMEEEANRGNEVVSLLEELWSNPGDIHKAKKLLETVPEAAKALDELEELIGYLKSYMPELKLTIDLSFARGLAYYTGIIYEVVTELLPVSIAGGGRYDKLISIYGGEETPGTGFAIGLDRTVQAYLEAERKSEKGLREDVVKVAIIAINRSVLPYAAKVQDELIMKGVKTNIYVARKLHKLLGKIAGMGYRYAVIVGDKEVEKQTVTIRNLTTYQQTTISLSRLSETKHLSEIF